MRIVTRDDWQADPASAPKHRMRLPAIEVFVHHSVTPVSSNPGKDMRVVEAVGLKRFGQFSYSYCIHPEGVILEGAGLGRGAHTRGRNSTSFGVCWLGDYEERPVKMQQVDATRWLVAWLVDQGHLRLSAPLRGHRDVAATACPGRNLYAVLDDLRVPWGKEDKVPAQYDPALGPIAAVWQAGDGNVIAAASPDGDIYCWGCEWRGNVAGQPYWGDRKVARIGPRDDGQPGYTVTATSGETYTL